MSTPYNPFLRSSVKFNATGGSQVTWELQRWFEDPLPHRFQLQVSRNPTQTGSWTSVGLPALDADRLTDDTQRNWARCRDVWYRIQLRPFNDEIYYSPPIQPGNLLDHRMWRISRDMIRKEMLRANRYTGTQSIYLKRRRYGTPCPRCTDKATKETKTSLCTRCYNTGLDGGYFAAVRNIFVTYGLTQVHEKTDDQMVGTTQPEGLEGCRILGDPLPNSKDVIIDVRGGRRFYVHDITRSAEMNGYTIVTELKLQPADFSDIIYQYPVTT